jgi:hypothetical protein
LSALDEIGNNIIVFQEFDNSIDANISKTKLDAYGIPCFLTEENLANLYPGTRFFSFRVRLHLFEKDAEQARLLLNEQNLVVDDESKATCPRCRSAHLERDFPKKLSEKILSGLGVLFFGIFIPQKKIYRCLDCQQEFD